MANDKQNQELTITAGAAGRHHLMDGNICLITGSKEYLERTKDLIDAYVSRIGAQRQSDAARDREILAGVIAQKNAELLETMRELAHFRTRCFKAAAVLFAGLSKGTKGGEAVAELGNQVEQDNAKINQLVEAAKLARWEVLKEEK